MMDSLSIHRTSQPVSSGSLGSSSSVHDEVCESSNRHVDDTQWDGEHPRIRGENGSEPSAAHSCGDEATDGRSAETGADVYEPAVYGHAATSSLYYTEPEIDTCGSVSENRASVDATHSDRGESDTETDQAREHAPTSRSHSSHVPLSTAPSAASTALRKKQQQLGHDEQQEAHAAQPTHTFPPVPAHAQTVAVETDDGDNVVEPVVTVAVPNANSSATVIAQTVPAAGGPSTASVPPSSSAARRLAKPIEARHVAAAPLITMRMPTAAVHSGLLPTYKILVVGDAGVGKTNLLSRYCTERYDPAAPPTLGVEFFSRELDVPSGPVGQVDTVVVQLWDTAGQERSSMISSAFFRNAVGAMLVYDVSRRETLLNIPRWAAHVHAVASEDCVCFVVGNKYDLVDEVDASTLEEGRELAVQTVDVAEAEEIAHSLDMRLFLASAKRGDGVLGAFTSMVLSVNAVQSVKWNHTVTLEDEAANAQPDRVRPQRAQRRKSALDLRGFSSDSGGDGGSCAC